MLVAGKFAWVPHVKLPVKYLWYSGKFTCARRHCACVLREVLAASKQVNLPVITGKLHVTQVNCARDLFTCELHVKLPAFAGNFARDSFTVLIIAVSALKIAEFLLYNNTNHGCFSSETVIFIEIHAMCIIYQFRILLKNLFTSLNQSGVSMIIAESSKDVNPANSYSILAFKWQKFLIWPLLFLGKCDSTKIVRSCPRNV